MLQQNYDALQQCTTFVCYHTAGLQLTALTYRCTIKSDTETLAMSAGGVAEMTGRRGRIVGDAKGRGVFELRAKPESTEMDSLNVSETGRHMIPPPQFPPMCLDLSSLPCQSGGSSSLSVSMTISAISTKQYSAVTQHCSNSALQMAV